VDVVYDARMVRMSRVRNVTLGRLGARRALLGVVAAAITSVAMEGAAAAQPSDPLTPNEPPAPSPAPQPPLPSSPPPVDDPLSQPPEVPVAQPPPPEAAPSPLPEEAPEPMSEGRAIVVAWNTGFQWGIAPGVVFVDDKASFFFGLRLGYGFDTGSVIVVPGARLAGYFTDPNVYVGMPILKLVLPIDRFAPFLEGGAGVGHITAAGAVDSQLGVSILGGGGFMVHFTPRFGLGVEANYQLITGTEFKGFGVGPILALAF